MGLLGRIICSSIISYTAIQYLHYNSRRHFLIFDHKTINSVATSFGLQISDQRMKANLFCFNRPWLHLADYNTLTCKLTIAWLQKSTWGRKITMHDVSLTIPPKHDRMAVTCKLRSKLLPHFVTNPTQTFGDYI